MAMTTEKGKESWEHPGLKGSVKASLKTSVDMLQERWRWLGFDGFQ